MPKKADIPKQIIDAAMELAAERGWHDLSLSEIAAAAKVPLSRLYPVFPSKQAILNGLSRRVDAAVLADTEEADTEGAKAERAKAEGEENGESARDRLFEVLMRRFDALQPYKPGLGNVIYDQGRDPLAALCGLPRLLGAMALMLEAAGISSNVLTGAVRAKGLAAIYLTTIRVWLRDDSPDLAKTMAALDRRLRCAESVVRRVPNPMTRAVRGAA